MLVFRPRTPNGYAGGPPTFYIVGHNPEAIITGINNIAQGIVVAACNDFTYVRFLSSLEFTKIPLRIENEFGQVLEERWTSLNTLISFIESGNACELYERVRDFPYVSQEIKLELQRRYAPETIELEPISGLLQKEIKVTGPVGGKVQSATERAVNEVFQERWGNTRSFMD